jgi:hypothetical protein
MAKIKNFRLITRIVVKMSRNLRKLTAIRCLKSKNQG